jgi:crotonobetainyl-CoA:carnitine CoA-transferase CaiB-like acyl-CoA transferase
VEEIEVPGGQRVRAVGLPFGLSGIDCANRLPVPTIGQHDEIVRRELARTTVAGG